MGTGGSRWSSDYRLNKYGIKTSQRAASSRHSQMNIRGKGVIDEDALNIFTDGSSFPHNKRAAGLGIRLVWVNEAGHEELHDHAPLGWASATSDEMELKAVSAGLEEALLMFPEMSRFKRVLVFSDSLYVVDNYIKALHIWPKKRWLGSNGMPVKNIDLWKELGARVRDCPIRVSIAWVRGHKGNVHNAAVDKLAKQSAQSPLQAPISVSATTKKWSKETTRRGCVAVQGQVLKIRIISRKFVRRARMTEYRYEVIESSDPFFGKIDFAYCEADLSRNKCHEVRLNSDPRNPTFVEVLSELAAADYKY